VEDAARERVRAEVREAQADYDAAEAQVQKQIAAARRARRASFKEAQDAGLTLREIGEATGLHNTTVGEILRGG
jgi:outer membrane protein TolC